MKTLVIRICAGICLLMLAIVSNAQTIKVRFPDTTGVSGSIIDIPLYVDSSLTGKGVVSYQVSITYNTTIADVLSVIHTGTMCAGYGAPVYTVNTATGTINISSAGATALVGTGVLFKIRFQFKQVGAFYVNFGGGTAANFFNQGLPSMNMFYGYTNSLAPASIQAYFVNGAPLTVGDSMQVSVSGGTAPYTYSVTSPALAGISPSGMFYAGAAGKTKVRAESANGLVDTTDEMEIRSTKLTIPDTTILPLASMVLPVRINSTNGAGIFSGSFRIDYSSNYIVPDSVILTNTVLAGKLVTYQNFPGYTLISFASTVPLTGSGDLMNIRFRILNPSATWVSIQNILLNQATRANNKDGLVSFVAVPALSLYPNTGEIFASQTQQFTATGGKPPYQFFVSDTAKASMSASGLMVAKRGGTITARVKDSLNTTAGTGVFQVYDAALTFPHMSALPNGYVNYPVVLSNMTGNRNLHSFQVTVSFQPNTLDSIQVILSNSLASGWFVVQNVLSDKIIIALAGTNAINTNGVFFRIRAKIRSSVTVGSAIAMTPSGPLFNESDFYAKVSSGSITVASSLQNDIGINGIQNLASSCTKSNQELVTAGIYNHNNIIYVVGDTILVGYRLNDGPVVTDTVILASNLMQYATYPYTFKQKADLSAPGSYVLKVMTQLPGDINRINDTSVLNINVYGNPVVNLGNDTTICSGGGFALNATNPSGTYVWSTSATTPLLPVSTSGTYWVRVTSVYNCVTEDTVTITVNPKPVTGAISGRVNVHVDTAAVYSVVNSTGSLYNWSVVGGIQLTGGQTNSISVDWDSLYYGQVRVVETNLYGCKGDTERLTMLSVVPVKLLSFSAVRETEGVRLYWQTASETNSRKFEIERSSDNRIFEKIGEVKGNGTTDRRSAYTFLDGKATVSSVIYYRLSQYDFDGKFAYSNTISVNDQNAAGEAISVFPNPTTSVFSVKGIVETAALRDILGNTVMIIYHDGEVDMTNLKAGVYFVQSGNQQQKIVKY